MKNTKKDQEREWLTPDEVAAQIGVSRMTVYRYIWAGKIEAVKLSRRTTRVHQDQVDRLLQARA